MFDDSIEVTIVDADGAGETVRFTFRVAGANDAPFTIDLLEFVNDIDDTP